MLPLFLIVAAASMTAEAEAVPTPAPGKTVAPDQVAETHPLEGPFASLEDWCKKQTAPGFQCHLADDPELGFDLPMSLMDPVAEAGAGLPWRDVRVFPADAGRPSCVLGVLTKRGWFAEELDCEGTNRSQVSVQFRVEDVIETSRGDELQLRIHGIEHGNEKTGYTDDEGTFHRATTTYRYDFDGLVVCGVGPSKTPRCTSIIELTPEVHESAEESQVALTARWSRGELVLSRSDGWPDDEEHTRLVPRLKQLLGRHRIVFR